jgi:hypothetical protein
MRTRLRTGGDASGILSTLGCGVDNDFQCGKTGLRRRYNLTFPGSRFWVYSG